MPRSNDIVATVAQVLEGLLGTGRTNDVVLREMRRLGSALDVDRVYIFENEPEPETGRLCSSQRFEWTRGDVPAEIDNPELQLVPYDDVLSRWLAAFSEGRPVHGLVRDFPAGEREILEPQQIQSLLTVPISVDGVFWGFMGFDAVEAPRVWPEDEIEMLRAAAAAFGTSLCARRAAAQLRLDAAVFEATQDAVLVADAEWRINRVNRAFARTFEAEDAAWRGRRFAEALTTVAGSPELDALQAAVSQRGAWQGEVGFRGARGQWLPMWVSLNTVRDEQGQATHRVAVLTDISRLKASEARLKFLSEHDTLTRLPNRTMLDRRLRDAVTRAARRGDRVGVLFLDLDRFKTVNDSLGHPAGDELLVAFSKRLESRLRRSDTVARLGGDEFVVLLEGLDSSARAEQIGTELLSLSRIAYQLDNGAEIYSSASVGVAIYPDDSRNPTELVQFADAAMYQAKAKGRARIHRYTADLTARAQDRLTLEMALRRAVADNALAVWFQPQVAVGTGRIVGAEALLRWRHDDGTFTSPGRFIPVAEETGLIAPLTEQTLLTTVAVWPLMCEALGHPITLSVNISPEQFHRHDVVAAVREALEGGMPPEYLELELTESTVMEATFGLEETLKALKALGVQIAIDDFGTGYSSFARLRRLPIDRLKIDRSFIDGVTQDESQAVIVEAMLAMAQALSLDVVAEGVETTEQLAFLADRDCETYQGFLHSMAMPPEVLESLLRAQRGREVAER